MNDFIFQLKSSLYSYDPLKNASSRGDFDRRPEMFVYGLLKA